ncbi:hypothetical protein ES708_02701 [subsurface metagenome]
MVTTQKILDNIKHIIHVSTINIGLCEFFREGCEQNFHTFDFAVNHYIEKHGYKLLHIGPETHQKETGDIFNCTVAVLGK